MTFRELWAVSCVGSRVSAKMKLELSVGNQYNDLSLGEISQLPKRTRKKVKDWAPFRFLEPFMHFCETVPCVCFLFVSLGCSLPILRPVAVWYSGRRQGMAI